MEVLVFVCVVLIESFCCLVFQNPRLQWTDNRPVGMLLWGPPFSHQQPTGSFSFYSAHQLEPISLAHRWHRKRSEFYPFQGLCSCCCRIIFKAVLITPQCSLCPVCYFRVGNIHTGWFSCIKSHPDKHIFSRVLCYDFDQFGLSWVLPGELLNKNICWSYLHQLQHEKIGKRFCHETCLWWSSHSKNKLFFWSSVIWWLLSLVLNTEWHTQTHTAIWTQWEFQNVSDRYQ